MPGGPDPSTGYSQLPKAVVKLSHYFDHLGVLVQSRVVRPKPVAIYIGGSIGEAWKVLEPYIQSERSHSSTRYQVNFEYLFLLTNGLTPKLRDQLSERIRKLRRDRAASGQGDANG
jgi:hypothetical protein